MAAADKSLNLHVATTSDASGLTQASTSLSGVDSAAEATTATFNRLGVEAQKVAVAMQGEAEASQQAAAGAAALDAALEKTRGAMAATTTATEATVSVTQRTSPALDEVAKAQRRVKEANESATKTTSNFGYAAMEAAYAADDLQYGFKGIVNNIPQILLGLGLGGGLTGVISILAVGINILGEKMGWWGGKAAATAEDLGKLANQSRNVATAAQIEAAAINAAQGARDRDTARINDAADAYKRLAENTDQAQKKREAYNRSVIAESDAELALNLTQIAQDKEDGKITDIEAVRQSAQAKRAAAAVKFKAEQDTQEGQRRALQTEAAKAEEEIRDKEALNRDLMYRGQGLLEPGGKKELEAQIKAQQDKYKDARKKFEDAPEKIQTIDSITESLLGPIFGREVVAPSFEHNIERDVLNTKAKEEASKLQVLLRRLAEHNAAKERTDFDDSHALKIKAEQDARALEEERAQKVAKPRDDANLLGDQMASAKRVYEMRARTSTGEENLEVTRIRKQQEEAARQRSEKDLADKRRDDDEADAARYDSLQKSGVKVDEERKANSLRKEHERRTEDEARQQALKDEARKRLAAPEWQGPVQDPVPDQGPTRSGFDEGFPAPPSLEGTRNQRRRAMETLDNAPGAPGAVGLAGSEAVRTASDALTKSSSAHGAASDSMMKTLVGTIKKQQEQLDRQTSQLKVLESLLKEHHYGR